MGKPYRLSLHIADRQRVVLHELAEEYGVSKQEIAARALAYALSQSEFNFLTGDTSSKYRSQNAEQADFSFIDLFAGIGGIRLAMERAGGGCRFSCEWDKWSQTTYLENFGDNPRGDIRKITSDEIPPHDVLAAGFPCQPFSIAGVSKKNSLGHKHGFKDETQGTLFFEIVRILEAKRPKAFLLENVRNLVSHDKGNTFRVIKDALAELNYAVFTKVLDANSFVPQHRERLFIIGFDKQRYGRDISFEFPVLSESRPTLGEILEKDYDKRYILSDKLWQYLQDYAQKHAEKGNGFGFGLCSKNDRARTLSARYYKDGSEILIRRRNGNPRRLTPRECARLMGFDDSFKIPVSDTQAYKQFGNSVVVPVVASVAKNLADTLKKLESKTQRTRKAV